jgi:hypothetical protein
MTSLLFFLSLRPSSTVSGASASFASLANTTGLLGRTAVNASLQKCLPP